MLKTYICALMIAGICAFFCSACTSNAEEEPPTPTVSPQQIAENTTRAAGLFAQREDVAKLREAVKLIAQIRNAAQRDYQTEWTFSQYNYFLGKNSPDEKESDKALTAGTNAGQIASSLAPGKPEGYFWYAANLGEQARKSPLTVGIKSVDKIRAAMNKVIEIQPDYEGASAFDALGRMELETQLIDGKPEKAAEYFEKGITYDKNNSYLHLGLGRSYLLLDRKPEAKKQFEYILQIKPDPDYIVEYRENLAEAKKLLENKF